MIDKNQLTWSENVHKVTVEAICDESHVKYIELFWHRIRMT